MLLDQNRIGLETGNGIYEEYVLDPDEQFDVLPGAFVAMKPVPEIQGDGITTAVVSSQVPAGAEIDDLEQLIVIENALLGKSMNHRAFPGEVILVYRPVSGDRYLARCIPGSYQDGDPLVFKQTPHGLYMAKVGDGDGDVIQAYAVERFVVPTTSMPNNNPPFFVDVIDDSTTERPSSTRLNGALVNLLRIRIA